MQLPHEAFILWMLSYGYTDLDVEGVLLSFNLPYDTKTIGDTLERMRASLVDRGGKTMVDRVEGRPPRLKSGQLRPMTAAQFERTVGCSMDLMAPPYAAYYGSVETINRVRPVRRVLQLLLAKGVAVPDVIAHLKKRFETELTEAQVACYREYFWPATLDYTDIYLWAESLPADDPDKELLTVCLDRDLEYIFWRLGCETSMKWDEGEFFRLARQGSAQQVLNAMRPALNPASFPPTQWVQVFAKLTELEQDYQDRNRSGQADDLYSLIEGRLRLELPAPRQIKTLNEVEGEVARLPGEGTPPKDAAEAEGTPP